MNNIDEFKNKLKETEIFLANEFKTISTGLASPQILDGIKVEAYGVLTPLSQLSSISSEGPKSLFITPFDKSISKDIEKVLYDSDLGFSVSPNDSGIRLSFPDLTAERREILKKLAHSKHEEAKVRVKKAREDYWSFLQENQKNGEISEDEKFSQKEKMEEEVKKINDNLLENLKNKESQIED